MKLDKFKSKMNEENIPEHVQPIMISAYKDILSIIKKDEEKLLTRHWLFDMILIKEMNNYVQQNKNTTKRKTKSVYRVI